MKYTLTILGCLFAASLFAQDLILKPLKDPKMHAGCYVENENNQVLLNLSEEDGKGNPLALIRVGEEDQTLIGIKNKKRMEVFEAEGIRIKVNYNFLGDVPDTCLELQEYKIKLRVNDKRYRYKLKGFCGC